MSPLKVVPDSVGPVAVDPVPEYRLAVVTSLLDQHVHPLGALTPVALAKVSVTANVSVMPEVNLPDMAPHGRASGTARRGNPGSRRVGH